MPAPVFHIEPGYEKMLCDLGLDSLAKVLAFRGRQIKDQRGRRDVLRVDTTRDGTPVTLFVKRMTRSYLKDGLHTRIMRGAVMSKARIEFDNTKHVIAAGFAASPPVAYGEDCGPLRERSSIIITEAAPGVPLDEWLAACTSLGARRERLDELGRWIRRLHDQGISFPDFFARHVFVSDRGPFALIDLARIDADPKPQTTANRARDLAALHASVALREAAVTDRLRVLTHYATDQAERRDVIRLVARRMKTLLRRRKFRGFNDR